MKTKIRLKSIENKQFGISVTGQHFDKILSVTKSMPVRHFDKEHRFWTVPSKDLSNLLVEFRKIRDLDIKASGVIKHEYHEYLQWKEFQLYIIILLI